MQTPYKFHIYEENQDLITELKAKLQFVENKLNDLQVAKSIEVETENTRHVSDLKTIDTNYASQISTLKDEVNSIQTQLNEVK